VAPGRPPAHGTELEQLLDDPYALARLIARAALSRQESRGAHRRSDFPHRDASLDGVHLVIGADERVRQEHWP
jgi:L-aspartate oxidase